MAAVSTRVLQALMASCIAVSVRAHGEQCRPYPVWTLSMRALCNGRNDLPRPLQICRGPKRLISEVYRSISNYPAKDIKNPASGSRAIHTDSHRDCSGGVAFFSPHIFVSKSPRVLKMATRARRAPASLAVALAGSRCRRLISSPCYGGGTGSSWARPRPQSSR